MSEVPLVVAFGGGVNSTAMIVEMHRRGIRPDLILFADTGGERPETYATVEAVSAWCVAHGMPDIETVKYFSRTYGSESLESQCLRLGTLPSIAYGFKTCSQKNKGEPQNKRLSEWMTEHGHKFVNKAIGFDAGESRRGKPFSDKISEVIYPLIEWNLFREDCEYICRSEGLPTAKSSCFFCPSMKKPEILELAKTHPNLMARALAMESNAELTSIKGLGRNFSWADFLRMDSQQMKMLEDQFTPEVPCGCYDG